MAGMSERAIRDVLAATPMFAPLSGEERSALARLAVERRVKREAAVVRRGESDGSLLILVSGRLRAGTVSAEGREVTLRLMQPGTVLGEIALLDGQKRSLDVTAVTDSALLVLERRDFLPFLLARPDLMLRMMVMLCDRLRRASQAFEDVALASLSARLAKLLLNLADEHGRPEPQGIRIGVKLSQKEMSAQVAATRERVNKQLRQWHEAGVLGEDGGHLVVRRPAALRAVVDAEG